MPINPMTGAASADLSLGLGGGTTEDEMQKQLDEQRKKRQQLQAAGSLTGGSGFPISAAYLSLTGNQY